MRPVYVAGSLRLENQTDALSHFTATPPGSSLQFTLSLGVAIPSGSADPQRVTLRQAFTGASYMTRSDSRSFES